jgi:hypothetical protein
MGVANAFIRLSFGTCGKCGFRKKYNFFSSCLTVRSLKTACHISVAAITVSNCDNLLTSFMIGRFLNLTCEYMILWECKYECKYDS